MSVGDTVYRVGFSWQNELSFEINYILKQGKKCAYLHRTPKGGYGATRVELPIESQGYFTDKVQALRWADERQKALAKEHATEGRRHGHLYLAIKESRFSDLADRGDFHRSQALRQGRLCAMHIRRHKALLAALESLNQE